MGMIGLTRIRAVRASDRARLGFHASQVAGDVGTLHPDELALVSNAPTARRLEFAAGRSCARMALCQIDFDHQGESLLADALGAPQWPKGIIGSITHAPGWSAAVATRTARRGGVRSIGLDAERAAPLPPGVREVVASSQELGQLARLEARDSDPPWDAVLFSAKEAAYKAWYPLTGILVGHDSVRVRLSRTGGFVAQVEASTATGAPVSHRVRGRWSLGPEVVVSLGYVG